VQLRQPSDPVRLRGDEDAERLGEEPLDLILSGLHGGLRDGERVSLSFSKSEKRSCRALTGFHGGRGLPSERLRERGLMERGLLDAMALLIGLPMAAFGRWGRAELRDRRLLELVFLIRRCSGVFASKSGDGALEMVV